jgi:hypothetical protein
MELLEELEKNIKYGEIEIYFNYDMNEDNNYIRKKMNYINIKNIIELLKLNKVISKYTQIEYHYNNLVKYELYENNKLKINYMDKRILGKYIDKLLLVLGNNKEIDEDKFPNISTYDYYIKYDIIKYDYNNYQIIIYKNEYNEYHISLKIDKIYDSVKLLNIINKINTIITKNI